MTIGNRSEVPWTPSVEVFGSRCRGVGLRVWTSARDGTADLTDEIRTFEDEIDRRVAGLYGVD